MVAFLCPSMRLPRLRVAEFATGCTRLSRSAPCFPCNKQTAASYSQQRKTGQPSASTFIIPEARIRLVCLTFQFLGHPPTPSRARSRPSPGAPPASARTILTPREAEQSPSLHVRHLRACYRPLATGRQGRHCRAPRCSGLNAVECITVLKQRRVEGHSFGVCSGSRSCTRCQ